MRPIAPNGALQAFCRRQNLGTGGIHFRRARSIPLGWSGEPPRNPKIKDRPWRSFFVIAPPRIPQVEERVRGKPLPVFPSRCAHRAQWRVTSVLPQAKPWHRRNSLPPSTFNPLGVERRAAAEPKNKRPPRAVFYFWCERWDLNPHDLTDTSTSSLPVCRFQHARKQNLSYYNKIPPFVKRQPKKLPESLQCARRHKRIRIRSFEGNKKPSKPCGFKGFPVGARGGT